MVAFKTNSGTSKVVQKGWKGQSGLKLPKTNKHQKKKKKIPQELSFEISQAMQTDLSPESLLKAIIRNCLILLLPEAVIPIETLTRKLTRKNWVMRCSGVRGVKKLQQIPRIVEGQVHVWDTAHG